jgi:hypothetical protein
MNLTEKEHTALKSLVNDGMNVINAKEPKELIEENQTWFNRESLSKGTGFSARSAAGLMSSLKKKDMVVDNRDGAEFSWFVTPEGILKMQEDWET